MDLTAIVEVGAAGGLGAAARLVVDGSVRARITSLVPAGTLLINVSGSLLLGVLTGLVIFHGAPATITLVAGTGFCGGYTTFSTASFETVRLLQTGRHRAAATSLALTVAGTLAGAGAGLALASL